MDTDECYDGGPSRQMTKEESFVKKRNTIVDKLWYRGGVYGLYNIKDYFGDVNEILLWIRENLSSTRVITDDYMRVLDLHFRTKEELMAFKLRWV